MFSAGKRQLFLNRLTALWALNEAGLGGLMHALRIPFTGIFIGGTAVVLITLIAYFARPDFKHILKSMLIVLIIKAVVSPHSPINAYVAVIFQGLAGFALFAVFSSKLKVAAFLLAMITLIEGAVQKILVMTIIYGASLWEAIDLFINYLLKRFASVNLDFSASLAIISAYFILHIIGGFLIGLLCIKFLKLMEQLPDRFAHLPQIDLSARTMNIKKGKKKGKYKKFIHLSILLFFIIGTLTLFSAKDGLLQGMLVFFRVFALILLWYLFLGPFLIKRLHRFLKTKSKLYVNEIEHIHDILPSLKQIVFILWQDSAKYSYLKRWKYFLVNLILVSLTLEIDQQTQAKAVSTSTTGASS
ncbi:hypothetical protein ACX8XP_04830 [Calditrichota bacterium LG25]